MKVKGGVFKNIIEEDKISGRVLLKIGINFVIYILSNNNITMMRDANNIVLDLHSEVDHSQAKCAMMIP